LITSKQCVCLKLSLWFAEQCDLEQSQFWFNLFFFLSLSSPYHLPNHKNSGRVGIQVLRHWTKNNLTWLPENIFHDKGSLLSLTKQKEKGISVLQVKRYQKSLRWLKTVFGQCASFMIFLKSSFNPKTGKMHVDSTDFNVVIV